MLSTTAEYALRIAVALTEAEGRPLTSGELSVITKVPANYCVKVVKWLFRRRLVTGRRGRGGGFRLACDPATTTLLDVVDAIDPVERILVCPLGREAHRHALCPLHRRLDDLLAQLQSSLGSATLQSVADGSRGSSLCAPPAPSRAPAARRAKRAPSRAPRPRRPAR